MILNYGCTSWSNTLLLQVCLPQMLFFFLANQKTTIFFCLSPRKVRLSRDLFSVPFVPRKFGALCMLFKFALLTKQNLCKKVGASF